MTSLAALRASSPRGGNSRFPHVPLPPACSRQSVLGRARHVGRGDDKPLKRQESGQ